MAARTTEQMGLTEASQILKDMYLKGVQSAFNSETVTLKRFNRDKAVVMGNKYVFPTHCTRNWGVGPRPETGTASLGGGSDTSAYLPPPGKQVYDQAYLQRMHLYGRFKITGPSLSAARGDGAMLNILDREMNGLRGDMLKALNRLMLGKQNGALTEITAGASASDATTTVASTARLEVGMPIVIANTSTKLVAETGTAVGTVSSITNDTTFEFSAAIDQTALTSHAVYLDGVVGAQASEYDASAAYGFDGLGHIINGAAARTYADISSSTYWDAERVDGSAGLSIDLMMDTVARMRKNANGQCSLILTSDKQWRAYGNLIDPQRRWAGTVKKLDGGFDALELNGIPVVWDPDCDHNVMYFIDESNFTLLEEEPVNFIDRDGSVLVRVGSGATAEDAYEATMVWRGALQCDNPHAQAVIYDLPS